MATVSFKPGHVGLNVTNLVRSKEFYAGIFGFEVVGESLQPGREYVFLGSGKDINLTLWKQSEGTFDKDRPGLHHLSFQVESMAAVKKVLEKVRERGAKVFHGHAVAHGEGSASGGIFFEDPDGLRLEVFTATGAEELQAATAGAPSCGFF